MSLLLSSDWRRTKFFDAPESTKASSEMSFARSSFKVIRETSLPDAVTLNDCVLGAVIVKRLANSLDIAGSVGAEHLLTLTFFWWSVTVLRFRNSVGPTPRNLLAA